jgi:hypothetical protein
MSLSAALVLAASVPASVPAVEAPHRVVLARAGISATILPSAAVRQASGPVITSNIQPRHQLSRRGRTVLVEFE